MSELLKLLDTALNEERWDDYDEIWLDFIEEDKGTFEEFLEAAEAALARGEGARAGLPLSLLGPQAETLDLSSKRRFYELLVSCLPREREHRNALIAVYEQEFGDVPGFPVYLRAANLQRTEDPRQAIDLFHRMVQYVPGNFVYHRKGWGVGEIKELLVREGAARIDFENKPGHRVQVSAIPDICTLLAPDHFLVLAWRDPEKLRRMAAEEPLELVKAVLATQDKPMTLSRIRENLVGTVMPSSEWTKWWGRQRTAMKKHPGIGISAGKTPAYFLLDGEESKVAEIERRLSGQDLRRRIRILREAIHEMPAAEHEQLHRFLDDLLRAALRHPSREGVRLEAILFLSRHHPDPRGLPAVEDVIEEWDHPIDAVNALPRAEDQQEVIDRLRRLRETEWPDLHREMILRADDAPREYLVSLLVRDGRGDEIDVWAREVNQVPRKAPFFYLWMTRLTGRRDFRLVPSLESNRGIDSYLRAIALLNDISLRADDQETPELLLLLKRFRQHLGNRPFTLLDQVTASASAAECRDIYNQVETCRGFSGSQRQGLLAFLLRKFPSLLAKSEEARSVTLDESVVYATDEGIARKRQELQEIRNDKLPKIYKAIGDAAALGDLSENAEFTSAIEERENLNRRALELQTQLDQAQRIDLSGATTDKVSLGSRVSLINLRTQDEEVYSILGPWDGDPEHGVVSYLSPLGRAMIDKRPGDEFEVLLPQGSSRYRVERIGVHGESANAAT